MHEALSHNISALELKKLEQKMFAVDPKTREFLLFCIEKGILIDTLTVLHDGNKESINQETNILLLLEYFLGTSTEKKIADSKNVSRQFIGTVLQNSLKLLWERT